MSRERHFTLYYACADTHVLSAWYGGVLRSTRHRMQTYNAYPGTVSSQQNSVNSHSAQARPSRSTQRTSAVLYDFFLYDADTIFVRVKKSPSEYPDHNEYSNIRPIRLTTRTCQFFRRIAFTQKKRPSSPPNFAFWKWVETPTTALQESICTSNSTAALDHRGEQLQFTSKTTKKYFSSA